MYILAGVSFSEEGNSLLEESNPNVAVKRFDQYF